MVTSTQEIVFSLDVPKELEQDAKEPIVYVGKAQTDKHFYDGGLRHAVGVHSFQVLRANRVQPPEPGGVVGWTYNHQPFIAYWKGKFYVHYLSNLVQEHDPPGRTLLCVSDNGREWSAPQILFPEYSLPEIRRGDTFIPAGTPAVMHQRMGFYVAPNDRLLALGFYSYCENPRTSPNAGQGLGRVVREVREDGSFGPVYFIRYNRHAGFDETNTSFPFYRTSPDTGFVEACESLLADKLMTLQWWEEDRGEDGFFTIDPGDVKNAFPFSYNMTTSKGPGKALCFFHRPDGVVTGIWKNQWAALSPDDGKTWTPLTRCTTLRTVGAKVWVQRTEDGKYALVYNHSANRSSRYPLTVMTGSDGRHFDGLLTLQGEVPPQRYQGIHRIRGPQYVRGIVEGNGDPPGDHLWNVYSMNKEDIWVSRTHVPIAGRVEDAVRQPFDHLEDVGDLELWNLYCPKWAPIRLARHEEGKCLQFWDEAPHDYARAERVFPEGRRFAVSFRVHPREIPTGGAFEIEVQDSSGRRPMRLRFERNFLYLDRWRVPGLVPISIEPGRWYHLNLRFDCEKQCYDLAVDGEWVRKEIPFAEEVESLERLVLRSGPYRNDVRSYVIDDKPSPAGIYTEDLAGSGTKTAPIVFEVDDVETSSL